MGEGSQELRQKQSHEGGWQRGYDAPSAEAEASATAHSAIPQMASPADSLHPNRLETSIPLGERRAAMAQTYQTVDTMTEVIPGELEKPTIRPKDPEPDEDELV